MTTTPDPKTVQQLATEHILDDARRAHDIGADVLGHFGPDALSKVEYHAYCDAVREAITTATIAVSWPAEQPRPDDTTRVDALRHTDDTPHAERLAQIRDRSQRLAAIPMETAAEHYVMRDMIDSIGDVRWLLEQLKPQHGVQREGSNGASPARDEASAREQADMYSRVHEPGCLPTPYHVVQRYVTDWQRVDDEQQPEDGAESNTGDLVRQFETPDKGEPPRGPQNTVTGMRPEGGDRG